MVIDPATLHDLDITLSRVPGGLTLLALLDRTRTKIGGEQLRRRIVSPARSAEEILSLQAAHRHLAAHSDAYRTSLAQSEVDAVSRYVTSTWQPPGARGWLARAVQGAWLRLRYAGYWRQVLDGRIRVANALRSAQDLSRMLVASGQAALVAIGSGLEDQLRSNVGVELGRLSTRGGTAAAAAFDQCARGEGKACLQAIAEVIGTIEAMWCLAIVPSERGWVYPTVGAGLRVRGLFHPLLKGPAVSNTLNLDSTIRACFVTGPNMAGKSTFLKAVAIAMLLAQLGCAVPAEAMDFAPVGALFSSMEVHDNLGAGESYYLAEVRRIKALATTLNTRASALAVVDEPFRGTNVHDATDATLAVISRLVDRAGLVFIASHLGELASHLSEEPRVCLLHFAANVDRAKPTFDYVLRPGVSMQRLGMTLLAQEGVLDLLAGGGAPDSA